MKNNVKKVIKNRFFIVEDLGQGGYGSVHKALDKSTNEMVAIKFNKRVKNFKLEYSLTDTLTKFKFPGFPKLISYGISETQNYIVTELLGPTLKDKLKEREGPFSMETVCIVGQQLLERLENMHSIGYIHLDLKPDNILLGSGNISSSRSKMLYLIDFGVSRRYKNPDSSHVQFKMDLPFTGNVIFASINSFLNYELSRRDDLESLMYLLVYLAQGHLPWLSALGNNSLALQTSMVKEQKHKLKGEDLCKDLPRPFAMLFNYVRNLDFEQRPEYSYLKKGLKSVLDAILPPPQRPIFDWHQQIRQGIEVSYDNVELNGLGERQSTIGQKNARLAATIEVQNTNTANQKRYHGRKSLQGGNSPLKVGDPESIHYSALEERVEPLSANLLKRKRKASHIGKKKKKVKKIIHHANHTNDPAKSGLNGEFGASVVNEAEEESFESEEEDECAGDPLFNEKDPQKFLDMVKQRPQLLTPLIQRRNQGNGRRGQINFLRQQFISIKNATIYEQSLMSDRNGAGNQQNETPLRESFEFQFDSSEFDEGHLNEGLRPQYDYEFNHQINDIKLVATIQRSKSANQYPVYMKSQ